MRNRFLTCIALCAVATQLFAVNDFSVDGINYTKLGGDSVEVGTNSGFSGNVNIPTTVINSGKTYRVVAIGNDAFSGCHGVTSVSLPNSITGIGSWAFRNCRMTQISIPNSVITIKNSAFRDCINLTSVIIGDNVQDIGDDAFDYCTSLSAITLGNKVSSIGSQAFYDCWALTSIVIPNSVIYTGEDILKNTGIATPIYNNQLFVYLPASYGGSYSIVNGISTIAQGACKECKNLTDISFPLSLHKISQNAFKGCSNISSITIPANVDTIERGCFVGCVDITDVYLNAVNPPYVAYSDWSDEYKSFSSNPTIHLACGVDYVAYQNSNWSNYNLEYPTPNYTLTLSSDEAQGTINTLRSLACNNDTVVIYAHANAGYHFTSWSDGNTENPRTIIMTQDKTLHANFAVSLYTFTATSEDAAKGTVTANNGSYQYGTELTMTATPADHYYFDHWNIEQERIIQPTTIVAKFSVPDSWTDPYAWIWETGGNGHWEKLSRINGWLIYNTDADNMNILLVPNGESFNGQTEDIKLTESACYTIDKNTLSITKSYDCITADDYAPRKDTVRTTVNENPYTLTLTTNTKAIAVFTTTQYQYCKQCYNGYIYSEYVNYVGRGNSGCRSVDAGTTITATVLPNDGYIFHQWSDGNTDNPRIFTISQDTMMEAFCIRDQCTLTLNTSEAEAGRVFGAGSYDKYTSVQIFAIPNSGYDFIGWSDNNTTNPRYIYLDENEVSLTATFELTSAAQYNVDVIAQNPEQGSASATNYVRLDAIPVAGCTFVRWSDGNTDNPRYMELNADITLQAIFEGTPSGVKNPSSSPKGSIRKVIVNGNMLIIKDDKTYTLTGAEVK